MISLFLLISKILFLLFFLFSSFILISLFLLISKISFLFSFFSSLILIWLLLFISKILFLLSSFSLLLLLPSKLILLILLFSNWFNLSLELNVYIILSELFNLSLCSPFLSFLSLFSILRSYLLICKSFFLIISLSRPVFISSLFSNSLKIISSNPPPIFWFALTCIVSLSISSSYNSVLGLTIFSGLFENIPPYVLFWVSL